MSSERGTPAFLTPWVTALSLYMYYASVLTAQSYICGQCQAVSGRICPIRFIGYSSIAAVGSIVTCDSLPGAELRRMAERPATRLAV
jgi:hypothetical protein